MHVGELLKMIREMLGRDIAFEFLGDGKSGHYEITPYSFNPHIGKKMSPRLVTDLGQGILHMIEQVHREINPNLTTELGYLVEK
jgi:UDP-glucose 4-epimerase